MLKTLLVLGILSSFSHPGADAACTEKRLDRGGGSMEYVQYTNQREWGTCAANAMAGAFDAWRFSHADQDFSKQTSPYALALLSSKTRIGDRILPSSLIQTLHTTGACDRRYIDSLFSPDPQDQIPESQRMNAILNQLPLLPHSRLVMESNELYKIISSFKKIPTPNSGEQDATKQATLSKLKLLGMPERFLPTDEELSRVLSPSVQGPLPVLSALLLKSCRSTEARLDVPKELELAPALSVNDVLDRENPQPVYSEVCMGLFREGMVNPYLGAGDCAKHAVLVIGRRPIQRDGKEVCQYLIRNSWGTGKVPYYKDWEQEAENVWVDATAFNYDLHYAAFLDLKSTSPRLQTQSH